MKDKLRDLAGEMRNELCSDFAQKLEAILDAEGDGGAVAWMLESGDCLTYWPTKDMAEREQDNLRILGYPSTITPLYTNPARSGVVRDEDVIHAWGVFCHSKEIADATTGDKNTLPHMRAALEHFAKGKRHA